MNLKSILRIAKTVAPVVVPIVSIALPVIKQAVRDEKVRTRVGGG
jgi:hypothetical protein